MNGKVQTYIGFAIKKGSAVFGCDKIKLCKKRMYAILYTRTLSENSSSQLKRIGERCSSPIFEIDDLEILQKRNCKAIAICDKSLAKAISENLM